MERATYVIPAEPGYQVLFPARNRQTGQWHVPSSAPLLAWVVEVIPDPERTNDKDATVISMYPACPGRVDVELALVQCPDLTVLHPFTGMEWSGIDEANKQTTRDIALEAYGKWYDDRKVPA